MLKSAVALHLNPTGISWAKLNSVNNQLCTWDYFDISNFPKKMLPNEIFQLVSSFFYLYNKFYLAHIFIL